MQLRRFYPTAPPKMSDSHASTDVEGSLRDEPKRLEEGTVDSEISEKTVDAPAPPPAAPVGPQPLPAVQLWTIVAAVSLAGFIYSMDVAIITTVSCLYHSFVEAKKIMRLMCLERPFPPSPLISRPLKILVGMEARTLLHCKSQSPIIISAS